MIEFWKHSLAVGVASKNIAQKAGAGLNSEPQNVEVWFRFAQSFL